MQPPIPPDIRRFVLTNIASIPHLEALLLLRANPTDAWPATRVAERLYVVEATAQSLLDDLSGLGMLARGPGGFSYRPASANLQAIIDELAELYSRRLVDITHLIHSRLDRQAQHFADAFRWRKDK